MEELKGTIEHITYQNTGNGYTVAVLNTSDDMDITVVGKMPFLSSGDNVRLEGEFVTHPTFGEQFSVNFCERIAPEGAAAILKYLSSGAIKGIGPTTARNIVERFKDQSLDIISQEPERLAEISGISIDKAYKISHEYAKQFNIREIMLFLARFNITPEESITIYKALKDDTQLIIEQNPYILCEDEIGFSFSRAEEIASYFPSSQNSDYRAAAGILYVLKHNLNNGHTYLPKDKLIAVASELLGDGVNYCEEIVENLVLGLKIRKRIIKDTECIFLPEYYTAEEFCASKLCMMLQNPPKEEIAADKEIELIEAFNNIKYEELQKTAIKTAITKGLMVLTGGPGTGKTTTLNAIIKILKNKGQTVYLCAPTGRAAKRMSELTNESAKTIHRLLEVDWSNSKKPRFKKNEKEPLECDCLIIDEMSMVDILLFAGLLKALPIGCRLIMVGDSDQLPSVGAGNVLHDVISSQKVPSVCLNRIFRQAMQSMIVSNAHRIIDGENPVPGDRNSDFFIIPENDPDNAALLIRDLYCTRLKNAYKFNPVNDIQILCPSKMMDLGSVNLNNIIQSIINPESKNKRQLSFKGFYLREGDKVMQTKNNYDIPYVDDSGESGNGVFNGDIGFLEKIDFKQGVFYVRFEDKVATYTKENLSEIELSYAMTIHKSQGSEFECVIIPVLDTPKKLLYRNLLYTAVTRAKKLLIIIGNNSMIDEMIKNNKKTLRYSALDVRLKELFDDQAFN